MEVVAGGEVLAGCHSRSVRDVPFLHRPLQSFENLDTDSAKEREGKGPE